MSVLTIVLLRLQRSSAQVADEVVSIHILTLNCLKYVNFTKSRFLNNVFGQYKNYFNTTYLYILLHFLVREVLRV